jgi:hypothetical protein
MAADRVASLRAAAARKRETATSRARTALRELDQRGAEITFQSAENRPPREENQALKTELALAYGARRDAATAPAR